MLDRGPRYTRRRKATMKAKTVRKRERMRNDAGTEFWHDQIEPFCRFVAVRGRGSFVEVARRLQRAGFPDITSQQVRPWLVLDRGERVEPKFGVGMALLGVLMKMQDDQAGKGGGK